MNIDIFYKNVTQSDKFDKNSFVGKIIYNMTWSDIDYWELDYILIQISEYYMDKILPKEIFAGIICIYLDVIGIQNKLELYITNECYKIDEDIPNILDRFERLNFFLKNLVFKQTIKNIDFFYMPKEIL